MKIGGKSTPGRLPSVLRGTGGESAGSWCFFGGSAPRDGTADGQTDSGRTATRLLGEIVFHRRPDEQWRPAGSTPEKGGLPNPAGKAEP